MDSRELMLATSLRLFSLKGYDGCGVQEIVDACGLTKPSLYHHFGSKRALFVEIARIHFGALNAGLATAAEYRHDLPGNLTNVAESFFSYCAGHRMFARLMLSAGVAPAESEGRAVVRPFMDEQHRLLEEMFVRAAGDHGNMRGRSRAFASTFLGTLCAYVSLELDGHVSFDGHMIAEVVRQYSHGIYS